MDSLSAFAMGDANRGGPLKVFDWERAAQLIAERSAKHAAAGLSGDWKYTGGPILADGEPVPAESTYTYLASTWATPELEIDGDLIPCWRTEADAPGWDAHTYWPDSALAILQR